MKKFTSLMLCVAIAGGTASATPTVASFIKGKTHSKNTLKISKEKFSARSNKAAEIWRAKTQKSYGWNGESWDLEETYKMEYDQAGLKTQQTVTDTEGFITRDTYTYNENGMLATRNSEVAENTNSEYENSSKLSREYDSRLTSFITVNDQQLWTGDDWAPSNSYTQTITRNEDGNITEMERAVYFNGIFDPVYRLKIEYGDDKKATRIEESDLTYDYATGEYEWVVSTVFEDIIWEETNGQIVAVAETEDLFSGDNRIKSATVTVEDTQGTLTVEYTGPEYTAVMTIFDEEEGMNLESTLTFAYLDSATDPDSNHWTIGREYLTTNRYMMEDMPVFEENIRETYIYDNYDLIILEKVEYGEGDEWELDELVAGEVEYDEEHGYPLSWTLADYDYETGEMVNSFRAVYSDYEDVTGARVEEISSDNTDSKVTFYNLQGLPVTNPQQGEIYIKVCNGKSKLVKF